MMILHLAKVHATKINSKVREKRYIIFYIIIVVLLGFSMFY